MYNITFNNHVYKIYNSEENKAKGILTLSFSPADYSFDNIKHLFDSTKKEDLDRIIKTTADAVYITVFEHYTNIMSLSLEKAVIPVDKTEELLTINNEGKEVISPITTTEFQEIELIVVYLKYEDPITVIVDKLNRQINPSIDIETCTLDELKLFRQKKNSEALESFLQKNPLLYTDDNYYGVSKLDRDEMTQQYLVYELSKTLDPNANDVVKWHSKGAKCRSMSVSEFATLTIAIYTYTSPYYEDMQKIKEAIFSADTKDALLAIKIFGEQ